MSYEFLSLGKRVIDLADELKKEYKLSDYEAIDLALKAEKNEFIARAFVLTPDDKVTALEKIVHTIEDFENKSTRHF